MGGEQCGCAIREKCGRRSTGIKIILQNRKDGTLCVSIGDTPKKRSTISIVPQYRTVVQKCCSSVVLTAVFKETQ